MHGIHHSTSGFFGGEKNDKICAESRVCSRHFRDGNPKNIPSLHIGKSFSDRPTDETVRGKRRASRELLKHKRQSEPPPKRPCVHSHSPRSSTPTSAISASFSLPSPTPLSNVQYNGEPFRHANVQYDAEPFWHANVQYNAEPFWHANVQYNAEPFRHANVQYNAEPFWHANMYSTMGSHSGTLMYSMMLSHSGTLMYSMMLSHSGTLMYSIIGSHSGTLMYSIMLSHSGTLMYSTMGSHSGTLMCVCVCVCLWVGRRGEKEFSRLRQACVSVF